MSLIPNQTNINEDVAFFSTGGGGGAVASVVAGNGIVCNPTTGNVIVSNSGVINLESGQGISAVDTGNGLFSITNDGILSISQGNNISVSTEAGATTISTIVPDTNIGVPYQFNDETGVDAFSVYTIGTVEKGKFYPIDTNYYICNMSISFTNITTTDPYLGSILITLSYGGYVSYATVVISDTILGANSTTLSLVFQTDDSNTLSMSYTNQLSQKINSLTFDIHSLSVVDLGNLGQTGLTIFE